MHYHELVLAFLGLFLAGLVKGVTGIGYATCAMPLLTLAVGLQPALSLVVVPALLSNAAVLISARNLFATLFRFRVFYGGILPGIVAGAAILPLVDAGVATRGLAILTLCYVGLAVARPRLHMSRGVERTLALPAGMLNGVLTGLTGSQILPLVPYMLALRLDPQTQVQAINLAVTIASAALGIALLSQGTMTLELLASSCAGAVPAIAGTFAGNHLRARVPVAALKRLTLCVLVMMSASLVGGDLADAAHSTLCRREASPAPARGDQGRWAVCLAGLAPSSLRHRAPAVRS